MMATCASEEIEEAAQRRVINLTRTHDRDADGLSLRSMRQIV